MASLGESKKIEKYCSNSPFVLFLGTELAYSMSQKQGLKVTQVLKEKGHLTKILPEYLSNWVTNRIRSEGVEIIEETTVKSANLDENGKVNFTTNSGKTVQVDHVVVAVGKFDLAGPSLKWV